MSADIMAAHDWSTNGHLTPVRCVKCEWSGQKQDIPRREGFGVPLCPNGHLLIETGPPLHLGLIEEER